MHYLLYNSGLLTVIFLYTLSTLQYCDLLELPVCGSCMHHERLYFFHPKRGYQLSSSRFFLGANCTVRITRSHPAHMDA
jgi:hypothetical protein